MTSHHICKIYLIGIVLSQYTQGFIQALTGLRGQNSFLNRVLKLNSSNQKIKR